jgi:iron complex outermembrane receptor protein
MPRSVWVAAVRTGGAADSLGSERAREITVTATRREVALEAVPYSLSVVSGEDLARNGVTDLASLANEVPGLAYYDFGARQSGAEVPIIRGLNASDNAVQGRSFRTFEQSPVGTYIGNSPFDGYLQLDDIQRVEVLRGPQGTLYGAGSLGGALRIIPNAPQLGAFSGGIEASSGYLQGADKAAYTTSAFLNLPMGDTLAFRAAVKFGYQPGYVDVYGLLQRTGSPLTGIPVLADPADPVNSPGVFYGKHDWNDQNTFTGRASLLVETDRQTSTRDLAFIYANTNGDAGPWANPTYPGGAVPASTRASRSRPGSDRQTFSALDQQFWRRTTLASVDLSYDAGFATLSSTSTYATTSGQHDIGWDLHHRQHRSQFDTAIIIMPAIPSIRVTSSPACSPTPHTPSIRNCGWCRRPIPTRRSITSSGCSTRIKRASDRGT